MKILHIGFEVPSLRAALAEAALDGHSEPGEYYKFLDWSSWTAMPGNIPNLHKNTIEVAKEFNPDLTFMQIQAPNVFDADTVSKIPGFVLNWTWDFRQTSQISWMYDMGKAVSLTGFTNEHDVNAFKKAGLNAEYLQSGFDNKIFDSEGSTGEYPEIVFIGNNYPRDDYDFPLADLRSSMVEHLTTKYGAKFGVYGFGWNNMNRNFMYREHKEAECYRSCKIAINLSHYEAERYTSDRLLRLMGSGAFCLAKWYPGIEKDFVDGRHLRVWHDFEELDELIEYYLSHHVERKIIAHEGSMLVHTHYTWANMIDKIKKLM